MGVARRLQAATMKCTLVFALAIIAFANAGSSNPEDNTQEQACATLSGATAPDMWTSGVGSSTCTAAASESSIWYKGVCDNAAGTYAINAYSDDTCATAATGTFTAAATLPASVTYATSTTASVISCAKCPSTDSTDRTVTYIGAFFGAVLAYLLVVCFGMYVCFKLGMPCP